jgi:aspartyl protease family protein
VAIQYNFDKLHELMNTVTQKTGRGMLFVAALLVLGLLTWFFSGKLDQQQNPNQQVQSLQHAETVEVSLQPNRQGHYVFTGRINGKDVDFLVDTGATQVALPEATARRLGLPRLADTAFNTANGVSHGYLTMLDTLEIGNIRLTDVRAGVAPNMDGPVLLGMSALKQLELRQTNEQLILRQTRGTL